MTIHNLCEIIGYILNRIKRFYKSGNLLLQSIITAPIAQLDRASDFESAGRRFESSWARQPSYPVLYHGSSGKGRSSREQKRD